MNIRGNKGKERFLSKLNRFKLNNLLIDLPLESLLKSYTKICLLYLKIKLIIFFLCLNPFYIQIKI